MLKRNIAANVVGQAWTSVMAILFVPFYITTLGIEAYGLIGFFAMLQVWLGLLDAGMTPTVARETARLNAGALDPTEYGDILRSVEVVLALVGLFVAALLGLSSGWIATHWFNLNQMNAEQAAFAVAVMGSIIGLRFNEALYRSVLMGGGWQVAYNTYAVTTATFRNAGVIVVLLIEPTPRAFFLWQLVVSVVGIAVLWHLMRRRVPRPARSPRFSFEALGKIARFTGGMLAITILGLSLSQVDKIVLTRSLSLVEFGYYAFAWSVTLSLLALVLPVINAGYPRLVALVAVREDEDKARLERLTRSLGRLIALASFPAAITLALWAPEAVLAWSNDASLAAESATLIAVLALGFALNGPFQLLYHLQLARGWTRLVIVVYVVTLAAYIPALLVGTLASGAMAPAWLWVAVNAWYIAIEGPIVFGRLLGGGFLRWLFRDNLVIAAAALVAPLGARFMISPDGRFEALAAVAIIGMLSFLSAALLVPEARKAVTELLLKQEWLAARLRTQ